MWAVSRFMPVDVIYPEPVYGAGMQLAWAAWRAGPLVLDWRAGLQGREKVNA
jgi:hypothetical protein